MNREPAETDREPEETDREREVAGREREELAAANLVLLSDRPEATARVAAALAPELDGSVTLALAGELGSGKTALTRGLVVARGGDPRLVSSPTYVLEQIYATPRGPIHHFDAYRLEGPEELAGLGIEELLDRRVLVVVEWADRVREVLPGQALAIELFAQGETRRRIVFSGSAARWKEPLARLRARVEDLVAAD